MTTKTNTTTMMTTNPTTNTISKVRNHNLQQNKHMYDIQTLEYNIDHLSLKKLLHTQTLTLDFCLKYILNPDEHASCVEDEYICREDVLHYQPHIKRTELFK